MREWPEYSSEPLDDGRSWSATFDSWDERTDSAYYLVTLSDGGQAVATLMAHVSAAFSSDKPTDSSCHANMTSPSSLALAVAQVREQRADARHDREVHRPLDAVVAQGR